MKKVLIVLCLLLSQLSFAGLSKGFMMKSPVFEPNAVIPVKYTCDGEDISPALFWENPPKATQSFVLTVEDPDAIGGNWSHWIVFNIPADTKNLTEGVLPAGAFTTKNSWGNIGYRGPCPPYGQTHRYFFTLFALNKLLPLNASATKDELMAAMQGHVLGRTQFFANYHRE